MANVRIQNHLLDSLHLKAQWECFMLICQGKCREPQHKIILTLTKIMPRSCQGKL